MYVNKRKILIRDMGTGSTINIALGTNFFPVDNAELIQSKFVDEEVQNSINPIIDFKKLLFKPADNNWDIIKKIKFNLNFYTPETIINGSPEHRGTGSEPGVYSDIGFSFDDVFCRTNRFTNSFFRLSFYDTPISSENVLLFFTDVYTQIGKDQKEKESGLPLPVNQSPISFVVGDPVLEPNEIHEGFHLYWFKDLVDSSPNKEYEVYAVLQFNNALNGRVYELGPSKDFDVNNIQLNTLEGENGIIYLKVTLKNDNGIYKYRFEPNTKQNKVPPGVNLNPSDGTIPTLTFWQITP